MTGIAIDDEPLALEIIQDFCQNISDLQLLKTFENALVGKRYLGQHVVDLLFVDIDMPDLNGLDLVKSLPYNPMIIFTTAYKEYALEGFDLEAIDYLLKPFSIERFEKAVNRAKKRYNTIEKKQDGLFVYVEYQITKIRFQEIRYIKSLNDYIKIHTTNGRSVLTLMPLKKVQEKLPENDFLRIHRSYIISIKEVSSFLGRKIKLRSGEELPVSESHLSDVLQLIKPT